VPARVSTRHTTAAAAAAARAIATFPRPSTLSPLIRRRREFLGRLELPAPWKQPTDRSCEYVRKGLPSKTPRQGSARPATAADTAAAAAVANARAAEPSWYSFPLDPMTTEGQGDLLLPPPAPVLGPVLGTLPDLVFQQEVLKRLGPRALASFAQASHGCAAAVAATARMRWAKHAKRTPPWHLGYYLPPLCLKEACSHATRGGNREVLEWLHNTGCPWDATTAGVAAACGHLQVLQWLYNHGCPWNSWTCVHAARFGHLDVLQWARAHGCPWDSQTCMYAAEAGQLEVLRWVRENDATGEVWNEGSVRRCAGHGLREQEVLAWLDGLSV